MKFYGDKDEIKRSNSMCLFLKSRIIIHDSNYQWTINFLSSTLSISATEKILGEGIWVSPHNLYINAQIYLKHGAQSGWEWWTDRGSADLRRRLYSTHAIVGGEISLVLHQLLRYPWLKRVLWNMSLERERFAWAAQHRTTTSNHVQHLVHISLRMHVLVDLPTCFRASATNVSVFTNVASHMQRRPYPGIYSVRAGSILVKIIWQVQIQGQ